MAQIIQTSFVPGYIATQLNPEPNQALIGIKEPDSPDYIYKDGWKYILRLSFWDVDDEITGAFNEDHAVTILDWLEKVSEDPEIDTIIVHCLAGISRSAAVAKFISTKCGLPFNEKYMLYNKRVYSTLTKEYRKWIYT